MSEEDSAAIPWDFEYLPENVRERNVDEAVARLLVGGPQAIMALRALWALRRSIPAGRLDAVGLAAARCLTAEQAVARGAACRLLGDIALGLSSAVLEQVLPPVMEFARGPKRAPDAGVVEPVLRRLSTPSRHGIVRELTEDLSNESSAARAVELLLAIGPDVAADLASATLARLRTLEDSSDRHLRLLAFQAEARIAGGLPDEIRAALLRGFLTRLESGGLADGEARPLFAMRSAIPAADLDVIVDRLRQDLDSPNEAVTIGAAHALEDLALVLPVSKVPAILRSLLHVEQRGGSAASEASGAFTHLFACLQGLPEPTRTEVLRDVEEALARDPEAHAFTITWALHWNHAALPQDDLPDLVDRFLAIARGASAGSRSTIMHGLSGISEILQDAQLELVLRAAGEFEGGQEFGAAEWYADILDNPRAADAASRRLLSLTTHPDRLKKGYRGRAWHMLGSNAALIPTSCVASVSQAAASLSWMTMGDATQDAAKVLRALRGKFDSDAWPRSADWAWCGPMADRLVGIVQTGPWSDRRRALSALREFAPLIPAPEAVAASLLPFAKGSDRPLRRAALEVLVALSPYLFKATVQEVTSLVLEGVDDPRWLSLPEVLATLGPRLTGEQRATAMDCLLRRTSPGVSAPEDARATALRALAAFAPGSNGRSAVSRLITALSSDGQEGLDALAEMCPTLSAEAWGEIATALSAQLQEGPQSREVALRALHDLAVQLPGQAAAIVVKPLLEVFRRTLSRDEAWRSGRAIRSLAPRLSGPYEAAAKDVADRFSSL